MDNFTAKANSIIKKLSEETVVYSSEEDAETITNPTSTGSPVIKKTALDPAAAAQMIDTANRVAPSPKRAAAIKQIQTSADAAVENIRQKLSGIASKLKQTS